MTLFVGYFNQLLVAARTWTRTRKLVKTLITNPSKHPSLVVKMTFFEKMLFLVIICQIQAFHCEKMRKIKHQFWSFFRRLLKTPQLIPRTFIFNFLFIFRCFFLISGIYWKGLKWTKKVEFRWKNCFDQFSGAGSTWKLVEIHNTYLQFRCRYKCKISFILAIAKSKNTCT